MRLEVDNHSLTLSRNVSLTSIAKVCCGFLLSPLSYNHYEIISGKAMSERDIQKEILDVINHYGYFWQNDSIGYKGRKRENKYRPNGVPDILGTIDGRFIGIEVKDKKGKMLKSQERFRSVFTQAGGTYILARSLEDVLEVFRVKGII